MSSVGGRQKRTRVSIVPSRRWCDRTAREDGAKKDVRNWLITLVVLCFTLAASLTGCLWWYFTSDIYYGQQYQQIYSSKYITKEEKNMLVKEIRGTGFLPNEYYDVPKVCQGRINRNKQLIKERREQAEVNKGQFNTIPAIER